MLNFVLYVLKLKTCMVDSLLLEFSFSMYKLPCYTASMFKVMQVPLTECQQANNTINNILFIYFYLEN